MRARLIIASLAFIIIPFFSFAQSKYKADSVATLLKTYINTQNNPALYTLCSKNYRAQTPEKSLADFFTNKLFPLGQVTNAEFVEFDDDEAVYKLTFEKATLQLNFYLDAENKLDMLKFVPFKPNKTALEETSNPLQTVLEKRIDSAIRHYIQKPNTVGLSVGIFNKGKITNYGYGETAKGNAKLPDANALFEIGSITKTFTATLLAHYVLTGKVKLTDPITKYLPDSVASNKNLQQITLMQLSNHTSGLPSLPPDFNNQSKFNELNPYVRFDKHLLFNYLKACSLVTKPGEVSSYSNMGVGLLGLILEKVSGKSFEQMVTDIICKPLGMASTVQHISPALSDRFVSVYNKDGIQVLPWDFDALKACGSLRSTINDLLLYTKANMQRTGPLAKEFTLTHQVTFDKEDKVGLGWFIIKVKSTEYYFHNGGTGGSRSFLAFNVDKNVAVVMVANNSISVDGLGVSLLKLID
ncbi:beta-lactamase family protein [Mucilaginibacter sp. HMF5004]|uniref:serine hydrolase domain-containing protein n=1 Tax=Mucilaginibacter rivuli TaxID=2857527 RepID=UPI001C603E75|nr:serine hydrolase domain-containing protein [Mucilaginibacter rivuli]MBW4890594.1 beta-lactamase family protein [Mucilaginibacter rivuli]